MKNKLKVLWFGLIPLGWFLAFKLILWVTYYPITCNADDSSPVSLCIFLTFTGFLGTFFLVGSSIALAIQLQD